MQVELHIRTDETKVAAVAILKEFIDSEGFRIVEFDNERPWGAFAKIDESQIHDFIVQYFDDDPILQQQASEGKMSPKFLLVAPDAELSWQYHNRRSEEWKALLGPVGVFMSETDDQPDSGILINTGESISIGGSTRHRLVGYNQWGVVAEIWRHTDSTQPSDEDDIVRVSDVYGRSSPQS